MKIEFVIPTYKRADKLMIVLLSIKTQSNSNWKVHVVADGPYDGLERVQDFFKDDNRFKFTTLNGPHRDWGHTPRNYGLEHATEEWIVMSGDDNYYVPYFVDYFLNAAHSNCHFVFCDMIHNWVNNSYIYLKSYPKLGQIDIGNFMAKTSLAQQLRINTKIEQADGLFVEEYLRRFPDGKIHYIDKPLYVHN